MPPAELVSAFELSEEKFLLPVGVIEPAAFIRTERVADKVIE